MKNGQIIKTGKWRGNRWCSAEKQHHALLYNCPHYPKKIRCEIKNNSTKWKKNLLDPNWIRQQLESGIPKEAIVINQQFAGLRNDIF